MNFVPLAYPFSRSTTGAKGFLKVNRPVFPLVSASPGRASDRWLIFQAGLAEHCMRLGDQLGDSQPEHGDTRLDVRGLVMPP